MKLLILKLWYVACTIFCLYSLSALVEECYEVAIIAANSNEADPIIYLICKELSGFHLNKTELHLGELREELIDHFNRSKYYPYLLPYKQFVLDRLKTGRYLIFNGLLCIPFDMIEDKKEASFVGGILSPPVRFAFKSRTLDFVQIAKWSDWYDQLIVQKRGLPYSNCSESNGKFRCLNKCFKKKFRLARYFYKGNETGPIYLKPAMNRTIEENEKICFEKCLRENCKIVQLSPIFEYGTPKTTILRDQPRLSEFDFWIQYIGLLCSFVNSSLDQFATILIKFASSKVKRRRVRIGLIYLKWTILFLSLACCGYLYTTMFLNYKSAARTPPRKEVTKSLIKQETVRLAICVDINVYSARNYFNSKYSLKRAYFNINSSYFKINGSRFNLNDLNKTMSEIEKDTNGALDDHLKNIHLNYQSRMFRMDYILEPKVLFKKPFVNSLYRCFFLLIRPDYQLIPSNPKLTIRFKKPIYFLKFYLLVENENLNERTLEYKSRAFMKHVVKRLERGSCVKSRERYENCTSKQNCVERCINREAFERFKKITFGDRAVVDKEQFSPEEWGTNYQLQIPYFGSNRSEYNKISEECEKKFQDYPPCVELMLNETVEIMPPDLYTMEIDLFLDIVLSIEEFTWFNLLLDILNVQSIFFNMTVLKLLWMLYSFFKPKLRVRNDKIVKYLIYLFCSIGLTWHTYRILELAINEELTYSPNYEVASRVRMPILVFCLPIDEKLVDRNHQLTGNYLEQVTSEMTPEKVFKSILYLDESNEWTPFNLSLVEQFFYLNLKCFRISIDQEYERRQFHFSINSQVLKVNFNDTFLNKKRIKTVFFMTKINETQFSNILDLHLFNKLGSRARYSVEQSEHTVKYADHLSFIKQLLSTSHEDHLDEPDGQLPEMKSSGFRFRTLKFPVEKEDFDRELQDDLFEQFSIQIENEHTCDSPNTLDYQKKFIFNQLKFSYSDSAFTFSLALIKKTLLVKNDEFAKFVLNLLNVLIWFNLGILDLHPIFILAHDYLLVYLYLHWPIYLINKITQFLFFSHRWLKKFERPLYIRLSARRLRVPRTRRFYFKPVDQASSS